MVEHLYVQPDFQRAGIGSALLEVAKSRRPGALRLWVFQRNHGARAVYARHGFTEVRFTDGPDNEEQEPDVFLAYLRNGLDEQRERRSRPPLSDGRRSLGASPASVARCSLGRM
jgi:ribosomal protein S18 acetylase RimI-like enzyme